MEESEFFDRIRCAFPGYAWEEAIAVAREGCSISANAAFGVVDEVSRPPTKGAMDRSIALDVLAYVEAASVHPLAPTVLRLARSLVDDQIPFVEDSVRALREIEAFPGQYAALGIAYLACDDVDGIADAEYNRIRAAWDGTR